MISLEFLLGILIGSLVYYKIFKPVNYWSERYITHLPPWPLVGNMGAFVMRTKHIVSIVQDIYKEFPSKRYVGYMQFTRPALILRDLELIKQIGIKAFDHFHDHMDINTKNDELLSKTLTSLTGPEWRQMRATLSPAFTSNKMRNMYHLMEECAKNFIAHFQGKNQVNVEMKDVFSRFANDVIATTAFGINVDSLSKPQNEFFEMGKKLTKFNLVQALKVCILLTSQTLTRKLKIQMLPQSVTSFFRTIIKENMSKRESERILRPDLIHLLMEARKGQLKHENLNVGKHEGFAIAEESHIGKNAQQMELTDEHIIAQALLFFFAGFETVSTASCFMAYELALNPDVQRKLQEEVDSVKQQFSTRIPYDSLLSMKYLDQVVCETLRLWPPAFQTDRNCTKKYKIPPQRTNEREVLLEEGVLVIVPIIALHRDPQYFPEPDRFIPERFNEENRANIVSGSYLPFGIGPRNCIGSRFALLEIKTLFFYILANFDIVPVDKTEIPLKLSPKTVNMLPDKGFHLGFKSRFSS